MRLASAPVCLRLAVVRLFGVILLCLCFCFHSFVIVPIDRVQSPVQSSPVTRFAELQINMAAHGFPCDLAKALFPLTSAILPSSQTSWQTLRHAPKSAEDCTHFFFSHVIHRSIERSSVSQSVRKIKVPLSKASRVSRTPLKPVFILPSCPTSLGLAAHGKLLLTVSCLLFSSQLHELFMRHNKLLHGDRPAQHSQHFYLSPKAARFSQTLSTRHATARSQTQADIVPDKTTALGLLFPPGSIGLCLTNFTSSA